MRLAGAAWWLQFRILSRSPFFMGMSIMTPLAYGAIVLLMSHGEMSLRAVLGTGLMGAWSATLFGAAEALFMQRFTGTLEFLVGAPRSLVAPVFGFASATVCLGVYSIVAVLAMSLAFGHIDANSLTAFGGIAVALLAVVLSLVAMGVFLAGLYVLTRRAIEITNVLEYPIWLACGIIVPTSALWVPLSACGLLFPLGWATLAVDRAASGADYWGALGMALALTALFTVLGIAFLHRVDVLARKRGTLRLR